MKKKKKDKQLENFHLFIFKSMLLVKLPSSGEIAKYSLLLVAQHFYTQYYLHIIVT